MARRLSRPQEGIAPWPRRSLPAPLGTTRPKVFSRPRIWLESSVTIPSSCVGAPSRPACLAALDPHFAIPARPHQLRQTLGIIAIGLVDPHVQRGLGLAGVETNHRQPSVGQRLPQPSPQRPGLQSDPHILGSMLANRHLYCRGSADTGAVPDPFPLVIQDMHLRLFQRDVQPDILTHGGSPPMPLHYQL